MMDKEIKVAARNEVSRVRIQLMKRFVELGWPLTEFPCDIDKDDSTDDGKRN